MGNYEKLSRQLRRSNIVLICMVVVCLAIIIFLLATRNDGTQQPEHTDAPGETAGSDADLPQGVVGDTLWIPTPYISLAYPAHWEQHLSHGGQMEDGVYTHRFVCTAGGSQTPLFDVHFGSEALGSHIGYIVAEEGKIPVCVSFHDLLPGEDWSEEDKNVLYAMQEAVNDLLQLLRENKSFSKE